MQDELNDLDRLGNTLGLTAVEIEQRKAKVREQYATKNRKTGSGSVDTTDYNTAQNSLKLLDAQFSASEKNLDSQLKNGLISQQQYLSQRAGLFAQQKQAITGAVNSEISALEAAKAKSTTTAKQRIQLDQKIADARTELTKRLSTLDAEQQRLQDSEKQRLEQQAKTNCGPEPSLMSR